MRDMVRQIRGIALILFGILLTLTGDTLNRTLLRAWDDSPFSLLGLGLGVAGLVPMFRRDGRQNRTN